MSFTPEGNNYQVVRLAGDIMKILTAPKGLWVFDNSLAAGQTQTDYSNNSNTATSVALASTDKAFKGNCPYVNFPSDNTTKYLSIADSDTLSFGTGLADSAFSVFALVNVVNNASNKTIFAKWDENSLREYRFQLGATEELLFVLYDETLDKYPYRDSNAALSIGWHFVGVTYDGTGGATAANGISLYDCSTSGNTPIVSTAHNDVNYVSMENLATKPTIGAIFNADPTIISPLNGGLGLVGVTGEVLTAAQIWKLWLKVKAYYQL